MHTYLQHMCITGIVWYGMVWYGMGALTSAVSG